MLQSRWFGTLKARLMALWALVIAACVLGVTLLLLERVERRSVQAVTELEIEHVGSLAGIIGQRVLSMQRTLRLLAQQVPAAAFSDEVVARRSLSDKPALGATFDTTFMADASGRVLAVQDGANVTTPLLNLARREYFQRTVGTGVPVVSSPIRGSHSQTTVLMFTVPVFDSARQVVGAIGGSIRLAERNLLDDLTYAAGDNAERMFTVITDAQGTIVSHPRRDRVGADVASEPRLADAAARWAQQGKPVEPSAEVWREKGQFLAVVGVPGADWVLFRAVPEGALLGDMVQARREAFAWAAVVALAGALLMLAALAHQLGPLKRLRDRALRMNDDSLAPGDGWPDARGEIGDLSRALRDAVGEAAAQGRAQAHTMQRMRSVLATAPIGIAFVRLQRFELVGAEFCALLGWPAEALAGRMVGTIFASEADHAKLHECMPRAFDAGQNYSDELQLRRHDGTAVWCQLQGRALEHGNRDAGSIWLIEDVTERRAERERLSWSASHDMLTRLLNRAAFEQRLAELLAPPGGAAADKASPPATLLVLDLDRFKQVNDSAGHAAGDQVLRQVASLLHEHVRGGDAAARLGGDEFALLLPACDTQQGLALAERLLRGARALGVMHEGQWLGVGLSIGVLGLQPGHGDVATSMTRADAALYDAKRAGRGRACVAPLPLAAPPALQLVGT